MGYIRHQATVAIVLAEDKEAITAIEELRGEMADENGVPNCIVGPVKGINAYVSYAFLPDGSKEGWASSKIADRYREKFLDAVRLAKYPNAATIQLGGDDGETQVLFSTDSVVAA